MYLNQLAGLGCRVTEMAEPGLSPELAAHGPEGVEAYVHLPNFLIVAARRAVHAAGSSTILPVTAPDSAYRNASAA
jgi:hypothetical protein